MKPGAVTKNNIDNLDFSDLNWTPYFDGENNLGQVEDEQLEEGESLWRLIPEEIINTRIEAMVSKIKAELAEEERVTTGAITNGGLWFMNKVLGQLNQEERSKIKEEVHIDIKSKWSTQSGDYEVRLFPKKEEVEGVYWIFEGVADCGQTLEIVNQRIGEMEIEAKVWLLADKVAIENPRALPEIAQPALFLINEKLWIAGCGPDGNRGRFREVPEIVVCEGLK